MDPRIADVAVADPGAGQRLGPDARARLQSDLRQTVKSGATCLLLRVEADAWHHAPEMAGYDPAQLSQPAVDDELQSLVRQLFGLGTPVVVQLDGAVSGLGLALALAADLRAATPRTTFSLGQPGSAAGLLGGTTWLMARAAGTATLSHLAWTGEALTASRAHELGLVSLVSTDTSAAAGLAGQVAAVPAQAASALKRALTSRQRTDLDATLDYESWLVGVATGNSSRDL